jgi:hypothetical protein
MNKYDYKDSSSINKFLIKKGIKSRNIVDKNLVCQLHKLGYSDQKIANKIEKEYNIKISREGIGKIKRKYCMTFEQFKFLK